MEKPTRLVWIGSLLWPKLLRGHRMSLSQGITRLVFLLIGVALAVGIYHASLWLLKICYEVEAIGPLLCRRLLEYVLLAMLSVLLLSNIVTALSSFFLAKDLELLATTPAPPRTLFGARFLEQIVTSSWMVLCFGFPTLMAFSTVAGTGLTVPAIAAVLLPLLVYPASAGVVLTLLMVRFLPAARVRNLVAGLIFVLFIVMYLLFRLLQPERFINPEGFASLIYLLSSLSSPTGPYLPSYWGTDIIARTFREAPPSNTWPLMIAALWTGAGASYVVASTAFRKFHAAAYSRSQEGRGAATLARLWARLRGRPLPAEGPIRAPGRRAPASDWLRWLLRVLPPGASREFVIKDIKLLLRDASQWSQLALLLALIFVYLYNFRHFREIGDAGLVDTLALYIIGMALCGFVVTAVSVRLAYPLISLEGRMLWLVRTAPLPASQVLRSKLLSTLPPLLFMAELMAVVSCHILGVSLEMRLLGAALAAIITVSVASLSTGLGALLPDYKAETAAKVASSFGGLICMCSALLVGLALVLLSVYPSIVIFRNIVPRPGLLAISLGGMVLITLLSVYVPMKLGARALERLEP